jgi:hypothetical protein
MPVFSFTAPHITVEEEKEERDSLSDDAKQQLQDDLCGQTNKESDATSTAAAAAAAAGDEEDEDGQVIRRKVHELENEVLNNDGIPEDRRKDYLEAKRRVPELGQREANPIQFLRCDRYDVSTAVHRMLLYWKTRRKIFGEDRAFLPMTLDGAMKDDISVVQSGIFFDPTE